MDDQEKQLIANTLRAVGLGRSVPVTKRDLDLMQYSDETRKAIIRAIEANPAMEETFFKIAELAFMDGECNVD
jgi:hypothetical protein